MMTTGIHNLMVESTRTQRRKPAGDVVPVTAQARTAADMARRFYGVERELGRFPVCSAVVWLEQDQFIAECVRVAEGGPPLTSSLAKAAAVRWLNRKTGPSRPAGWLARSAGADWDGDPMMQQACTRDAHVREVVRAALETYSLADVNPDEGRSLAIAVAAYDFVRTGAIRRDGAAIEVFIDDQIQARGFRGLTRREQFSYRDEKGARLAALRKHAPELIGCEPRERRDSYRLPGACAHTPAEPVGGCGLGESVGGNESMTRIGTSGKGSISPLAREGRSVLSSASIGRGGVMSPPRSGRRARLVDVRQ